MVYGEQRFVIASTVESQPFRREAEPLGGKPTDLVRDNDRVYVYDAQGVPAGMLSGRFVPIGEQKKAADFALVHPLSYVTDRSGADPALVIAWRAVDQADLYEIRHNDSVIDTTDKTSLRIPLRLLELDDYISVHAIDIDASPEQILIGTMVLITSPFTVGVVDTEAAEAESLNTQEVQSMALASNHYFRSTTFIPYAFVKIGWMEDMGCNVPAGGAYFGGDNRSFSYSSSAYRTRANVWWTWGTTTQGYARYVGTTKVYNSSKSLISSKTASSSGIEVFGPYVVDALEKRFHIRHKVANPYCNSLSAIDYSLDMYVERTAGYNGFTASGKHDRAPSYEFYYDDNTISPVRFYGALRVGVGIERGLRIPG